MTVWRAPAARDGGPSAKPPADAPLAAGLQPLRRRFASTVARGSAPIALLLVVLAAHDVVRAYEAALDRHRQAALARQAGLVQVATSIHGHLDVLHGLLADRLADPSSAPRPTGEVGLPPRDAGPGRGALLAPGLAGLSPEDQRLMAAAEALFPVQRALRQTEPTLRWSYVFGTPGSFVSIYPWGPLADTPAAERTSTLAGYFGYDVYRGAEPGRNPARRPFWTPAYLDAAGAGLMVSHAMPIDVGGRFRGMVGADILVRSLSTFLRGFPAVEGRFLLVDQKGSLVADPDRPDGTIGSVEHVAGSGTALPLEGARGAFASGPDGQALLLPVEGTPWTLVHLVPRSTLAWATLASALPYLALLGGILLGLVALYRALTREFVQPALALAGHVEAQADERAEPGTTPVLPAFWRPWLDRVDAALARQRELLDRVREAEGVKAAVIDAALDAVVIADSTGRIVSFNPGAERIFGYGADKARGARISELIVPPGLRAAHEAGMARFEATGEPRMLGRRIEVTAMRSSGETFPAEVAIHHVATASQMLFAAYLRDLTPERRAAAEIEGQRQRLHQVEKLSAMGSLLAGVAHELNNPLAILVAQATLLRDKAPDADVERRAERIHAAAARAGRIVKSFLAMARQKEPRREAVALGEVVSASLDLVAYGLRSAGIEVGRRDDPLLPTVSADRDLLGQVVANLLINAQQALMDHPGPRRILVATHRAGGQAVLTVSDSGPGVPEAVRERIYEPYFTTKPAGVGTGIGLSICRSIVEAHGGRIAVEAAPDGGALFRVELPLGGGTAGEQHARPGGGQSLTVLVVDDEPDVAASLGEIVEGLGHRAVVAASPEAALEQARRERFDCVFTDLRMPGLDGMALRERLDGLDPGLARRTVIVTGDTVLGTVETGLMAHPRPSGGPDKAGHVVMEKPFTVEDVQAALGRVLPADGR